MNTTFLNGDQELKERAIKYYESRLEDLKYFEIFSGCETEEEFCDTLREQDFDIESIEQAIRQYRDLGNFYDYGLSFDFQSCDNEEGTECYFRYQLGWGGPSDEIRFYEDGTIEYVFLDWFVGVGFDVSNDDTMEWLKDWFEGCGMLNFDAQEYEERFLIED